MNQWNTSKEKGYVLVFFGLALLILLPCVGLAADFGRAYLHSSYLQNAADAAALAGVAGVAAEKTNEGNPLAQQNGDGSEDRKYRRVRLIDLDDDSEKSLRESPSYDKDNSENPEYLKTADEAANPLLRENTKNSPDSDGAQLDLTSKDENLKTKLIVLSKPGSADKDFYYKVTIREAVQFLFAQILLPESLLPHWTIGVVAWATTAEPLGSLEPGETGGTTTGNNPSEANLYDQVNEILTGQTPKTFYDLPGNGVQEKRQYRESSVGIYYRLDENGENPTRTEYFYPGTEMPDEKTVDKNALLDENGKPLNANTVRLNQRYLFIDFKPDVSSPTKLPDGWDLDSIPPNLSYGNLRFNGMKNSWAYDTRTQENVSDSRWGVIPELMKRLLGVEDDGSPAALEAREKVMALLNTRIESIITFDRLYEVRGTKEQLEALGDQAVKNTDGKVATDDPLLVRIESEEFNQGAVTNSVRKTTIDIKPAAGTTDTLLTTNSDGSYRYRPLVFFYSGPIGNRKSQTLTLNLDSDFRGAIFAPNSRVCITGNNHTMKGFIIAKEFAYLDENGEEVVISAPQDTSNYAKLGLKDPTFDDFGTDTKLVNLNQLPAKNRVLFFNEQAKSIK